MTIKKLFLITGLATAMLSAGGNDFCKIDETTRQKLLELPAADNLIRSADAMLKEKALDPKDLSNDYVLMKNSTSYWPVKIGVPMRRWMHDLGYAYVLTGDTKYADKGIELLTDMVRGFPPSHPMVKSSGFYDIKGWFMWGMAQGYMFFSDRMTKEQRDLIAKVGAEYIDEFLAMAENPKSWWYKIHNYNGIASGAAALLSLALRDYPGFDARREHCIRLMKRWLDLGFADDGAYREGVGYVKYGLSYMVIFAWVYRNHGGENLLDHPKLKKLSEAFAHNTLPGDAALDARNDSDYSGSSVEMLMLAAMNRDPLAVWLLRRSEFYQFPLSDLVIASAGGLPEPVAPEQLLKLSKYHPDLGLANWRTGWGPNDVMLSIASSPWFRTGSAGTHCQADHGHFSLYAFQDRWSVDPGYGNDFFLPGSRSRTDAHSCLLIDGMGQGKTDGKLLKYSDSDRYGYALAECTAGYNTKNPHVKVPGARRVWRHALFLRPSDGVPAYAVILDDADCNGRPHDYTWQLITGADKTVDFTGNRAVIGKQPVPEHYLTTPAGASAGRAEWTFNLTEPGKYRISGLTRAGGPRADASDSFFIKVDGGRQLRWDTNTGRNWRWSIVPQIFKLGAGRHRIVISTREQQAELAALRLLPETAGGDPNSQLQLSPDEAAISGGMAKHATEPDRLDRMEVAINAAGAVTWSRDHYAPPNQQRGEQLFNRLRATTTAVCNPYFAAVLLPLHRDQKSPEIKFQREAGKLDINVKWENGVRDRISWPINAKGIGGEPVFRRFPAN